MALGKVMRVQDDMSPRPTTVTGELRCALSLYRRLSCPRGGAAFYNFYLDAAGQLQIETRGDPNYGLDVSDKLQDTITKPGVISLQSAMLAEVLKASFVSRAQTTASFDEVSGNLILGVQALGSEGLIKFSVAVTSQGLVIL